MKNQEQIKQEVVLKLMSTCNIVYYNLKQGDMSERFLIDYLQDRINEVIELLEEKQ